jgi:hypothetical protein
VPCIPTSERVRQQFQQFRFRGQLDLRAGALAVPQLQSAAEFVQSFFRDPELSYILPDASKIVSN